MDVNHSFWQETNKYVETSGRVELYWSLVVSLKSQYGETDAWESINITWEQDLKTGFVDGVPVYAETLADMNSFILKYIVPVCEKAPATSRLDIFLKMDWHELESNHLMFFNDETSVEYKLNLLEL